MSANINKIPHIQSFKPVDCLVNYTLHEVNPNPKPKPSISKKPSNDPYNDLVQAEAGLLKSTTKFRVHRNEDSAEETENEVYFLEEKQSQMTTTPSLRYEYSSSKKSENHVVTFVGIESSEETFKSTESSKSSSDDPDFPMKLTKEITVISKPSHPSELWKTFLAALILALIFILNLITLSIIHDNVPDDLPLPDLVLHFAPMVQQGLDISEYIIMFSIFSCITSIVLFHKYSSIVLRRIFLMLSVLYFYRTITMSVTILPKASSTFQCAPKLKKPHASAIFKRTLSLIPNFGMSLIGPQIFCGDLIYSGHTVLLVLVALVMSEYTGILCIQWLYWGLAICGILMLELSHGHYLIDVVIAYYVTTRLFWTYQTLANNEELKTSDNNYFRRAWWFKIFMFFEKNVHGPVPNECQWLFHYGEEDADNIFLSKYGTV